MTRADVLAWLEEREPRPPRALADQLDAVVRAVPDSVFATESLAAAIAGVGLHTLRSVVKHQGVSYDTAMDLLAADAFVTYAFEAAAEESGDVTGLAGRLLGEVPS